MVYKSNYSYAATLHCSLHNATYTTAVSYMSSLQTIQSNVSCHNKFNTTLLYGAYLGQIGSERITTKNIQSILN